MRITRLNRGRHMGYTVKCKPFLYTLYKLNWSVFVSHSEFSTLYKCALKRSLKSLNEPMTELLVIAIYHV